MSAPVPVLLSVSENKLLFLKGKLFYSLSPYVTYFLVKREAREGYVELVWWCRAISSLKLLLFLSTFLENKLARQRERCDDVMRLATDKMNYFFITKMSFYTNIL